MRMKRHPAGAQRVDRDQQVDRGGEAAERQHVHAENPEILSVARRVQRRERRVGAPAGLGRAALGEEAEPEDHAAEDVEPERERGQARERHPPRADHQRHEVRREPEQERHGDEEDHRRAVHRQHLVVGVAREEVLVGRRELRAHEQREHAAADEEDDRREDVEDPDALVVGRREPRREAVPAPVGAAGRAQPCCHWPRAPSCRRRARRSARPSRCCRRPASCGRRRARASRAGCGRRAPGCRRARGR